VDKFLLDNAFPHGHSQGMDSVGDLFKAMPEVKRLKRLVKKSPPALKLVKESQLLGCIEIRENPDAVERAYMARQLVQCTLPHSNPGNVPLWSRRNGNALLTLQPGSKGGKLLGYPYGVLPRLLLFWLVTEAVQEKKRRICLGKSLSVFMRKLGLDPGRGGKRSDATRLKNQMDKLFRARISFERVADAGPDMMEEVWIDMPVGSETHYWWDVKNPNQDTIWESWVEVGEKFFEAITAYPVPADMRALRVLKNSALALDLYVWATYRVHTANKKKVPQFIPWEGLMGQLGSEYSTVKDFKKKAWAALSKVHGVYPALKINKVTGGFVLHPGPTAVPPKTALADR
jgi:hypothetical protein